MEGSCRRVGICESFLGKWRHIYKQQGIEGLTLEYKGSSEYLTPDAKADMMAWLQNHHWNVERLRAQIQRRHGVVYQSRQSYYALLHEAWLSWKKSEKWNPKADPEQVKETRDTIKKNKSAHAAHWQGGQALDSQVLFPL